MRRLGTLASLALGTPATDVHCVTRPPVVATEELNGLVRAIVPRCGLVVERIEDLLAQVPDVRDHQFVAVPVEAICELQVRGRVLVSEARINEVAGPDLVSPRRQDFGSRFAHLGMTLTSGTSHCHESACLIDWCP